MAIFQKSIVEKYLKTLDESLIENAFDTYRSVYVPKIDRIRNLKEEQYQTQFLQDIFGSILGYTIDPEAGYNIELEKKNESNSKKADGAIVKEDKVLGVIELKSNKTKNLDSIKDQAFGYKNNHKGCNYVISSNFHKLRFYVDDATEYEEFDLYNLDKESFKKFYLFLRKEGLLDKNIPKLLKEETKFHEENISKQLYKDYSSFKNKFFENIVKNNPEVDKLILFRKSQKFLDRILFILFAEDKNLIPTNAIPRIVESWALADDLHYKPLYELFKTFFIHLNVGHVYKSGYEIPAYGGGLFMPDEVLDNLKVDDEILKDDLLVLSKYDFNTDVDVNILGHIFEHSLSEIEETEAKLKGEQVDKSKGKRKKDGVFYTPKYITKYIVDNTVGKLCNEKKSVLELDQDFDIVEYQKSNGGVNKKGEKLFHNLEAYKKWLLELKIVDPACGSGAFLNEALSFLIKEHKDIDDLIAELTNTPLRIFDTEKSILENNIYGVDINEESVEIAKLSMWLRTAQKGRQLSNLSNNIKCGNSLVDDITIAGDKAFNWENEFPQVFAKGGFDVVIGNPPYVRQELFKEIKPYLEENYKCYNSVADLYTYFIEKGINITKKSGLFSFIVPNKFIKASYGREIRKVIKENSKIELIYDFDDYPVFHDATTYPIIYLISKNDSYESETFIYSEINKREVTEEDPIFSLKQKEIKVKYSFLGDDFWQIYDSKNADLLKKLSDNTNTLKEIVSNKIFRGVSTGKNEVFIIDKKTQETLINDKNKNFIRKIVTGKEVKRNSLIFNDLFLLYIPWEYDLEFDENIKNYLINHKEILSNRPEVKQGRFNWWCLSRYGSKNSKYLFKPKIIYPRINNQCNFYFDSLGELSLSDNNFFISTENKYLLPILNSKVIFFYLKSKASTLQGGYLDFRRPYIETIPIKVPKNTGVFTEKADQIISLNKCQEEIISKYQRTLQRKFEGLDKLPKKLENWHELTFMDFVKELKKRKIKLSLTEEAEWEDYFLVEQQKAIEIKAQITKLDKEIDVMVYELYGLTDEEIAIIENDQIL